MKPLPESVEAADELDPDEEGLLDRLVLASEQVRDLVPELVGVSLAASRYGVTFTVVASDAQAAMLDAVQYTTGGPCVESVRAERVIELAEADLLDEDAWRLFSQATAAVGVRGTLSLPVLVEGRASGSVNLYASTGLAFAGHHEAIATVFGAWAPGAVSNADLSFASRQEAERAPQLLRERHVLDAAAGVLMVETGEDDPTARRHLQDAATRAGVTEVELAQALLDIRHGIDEDAP